MPMVSNPTDLDLFCHPLDRVLRAGAVVEVTARQAAGISRSVFVVTEDEPAAPAVEKVTRQTVKRGGKSIEVSGSPKGETR